MTIGSLERQLTDRESDCDSLRRQVEAGGDRSKREHELVGQVRGSLYMLMRNMYTIMLQWVEDVQDGTVVVLYLPEAFMCHQSNDSRGKWEHTARTICNGTSQSGGVASRWSHAWKVFGVQSLGNGIGVQVFCDATVAERRQVA